jgi:chromosome segregation ATPase
MIIYASNGNEDDNLGNNSQGDESNTGSGVRELRTIFGITLSPDESRILRSFESRSGMNGEGDVSYSSDGNFHAGADSAKVFELMKRMKLDIRSEFSRDIDKIVAQFGHLRSELDDVRSDNLIKIKRDIDSVVSKVSSVLSERDISQNEAMKSLLHEIDSIKAFLVEQNMEINTQIRNKISDLEGSIKSINNDNRAINQMNEVVGQMSTLRNEINAIKKSGNNTSEKIDIYSNDFETIKKTLIAMKSDNSMSIQIQGVVTELKELNSELEDLRANIQNDKNAEDIVQIRTIMNKLQQYYNDSVQNDIKSDGKASEISNQISSLRNEISDMKNQLAIVAAERDKLQSNNNHMSVRIEQMEQKSSRSLSELNEIIQNKFVQLDQDIRAMKNASETIGKLDTTVSNLNKSVSAAIFEVEDVRSQNDALAQSARELQLRMQNNESQLKKYTSNLSEILDANNVHEESVRKLHEEVKDINVVGLKKTVSDMNKYLTDTHKSLYDLSSSLRELSRRCDVSDASVLSISENVKRCVEDIGNINGSVEEKMRIMSDQLIEIEQLSDRLRLEVHSNVDIMKHDLDENKRLVNSEVIDKMRGLEQKVGTTLQKSIENIRSEMNKALDNSQKRIMDNSQVFMDSVDRMDRSVENINSEMSKIRDDIHLLAGTIDEVNSVVKADSDAISSMDTEMERLSSNLKHIESSGLVGVGVIDEIQRSMRDLQHGVDRVSSSESKNNSAINEMKKSVNSLVENMTQVISSGSAGKNTFNEVRNELQAVLFRLQQVESQIDSTKGTVGGFNSGLQSVDLRVQTLETAASANKSVSNENNKFLTSVLEKVQGHDMALNVCKNAISSVKYEIENLKKMVDNFDGSMSNIKGDINEMSMLSRNTKDSSEKIRTIENELQQQKISENALKNRVAEMNNRIQDVDGRLNTIIPEVHNQIHKSELQNSSLKNMISDSKNAGQITSKSVDSVRQFVDEMSERLNRLESYVSSGNYSDKEVVKNESKFAKKSERSQSKSNVKGDDDIKDSDIKVDSEDSNKDVVVRSVIAEEPLIDQNVSKSDTIVREEPVAVVQIETKTAEVKTVSKPDAKDVRKISDQKPRNDKKAQSKKSEKKSVMSDKKIDDTKGKSKEKKGGKLASKTAIVAPEIEKTVDTTIIDVPEVVAPVAVSQSAVNVDVGVEPAKVDSKKKVGASKSKKKSDSTAEDGKSKVGKSKSAKAGARPARVK